VKREPGAGLRRLTGDLMMRLRGDYINGW